MQEEDYTITSSFGEFTPDDEGVSLHQHVPSGVPQNIEEATCTSYGCGYDFCSECDNMFFVITEEKLPHSPAAAIHENEVKATCKNAGSYDEVIYCSVCGEELSREPITVDTIDHADENNDGSCDYCGMQMSGGDHCKFCGKIHNGGFFDKLTGFFHKIFAIFKR